ncbi:MAG: hypothetical protein LBV41_10600 [Cytophagaceae bacterium]|jgi:hypothetical protein|nr:hypothetical protein [Cytophagaceae bacterium]
METEAALTVGLCGKEINTEWNHFWVELSGSCYEQSSLWGKVIELNGWKAQRIILRKNGRIVCEVQMQMLKFK